MHLPAAEQAQLEQLDQEIRALQAVFQCSAHHLGLDNAQTQALADQLDDKKRLRHNMLPTEERFKKAKKAALATQAEWARHRKECREAQHLLDQASARLEALKEAEPALATARDLAEADYRDMEARMEFAESSRKEAAQKNGNGNKELLADSEADQEADGPGRPGGGGRPNWPAGQLALQGFGACRCR